jgi:hypothetical protein
LKLDALEHPKTLDLASRLEASLPATIGHLELLWAFTGKYAPAGDIGRHTDGAIARACHWAGRPELFILALREARFIDSSSTHRLTIHDWHDHAPRWVKSKLKSFGQAFVAGASPQASMDISEDTSEDSKGSERKRSEVKPEALAREVPGLAIEFWDKWIAYRKATGKPIKPESMGEAAKKMAALGTRQAEAVDHSIANSYQGLYLPKDVPRGTSGGVEDPDAVHAWDRLLATEGAERPAAAHSALTAVGGWMRVKERRAADTPFIRKQFIEAYANARRGAA